MLTKHQKQTQSQGRTINPGRLKIEGAISISNVMLVCKKCGKAARVGISHDGEKTHRVCKNCKSLID